MTNTVYIATSLDGYIADKDGGLDWLHNIPNPDGLDFGFAKFMERIDALVMGRNTFDMVCSFDGGWPYNKPVFVLSNSLTAVADKYSDKAKIINGPLRDIVEKLNNKGYNNLYIDGGITIQNYLKEDLIDEMLITSIPVLLGGGSPLFGELANPLAFKHHKTEVLLDAIVQNHYLRNRE